MISTTELRVVLHEMEPQEVEPRGSRKAIDEPVESCELVLDEKGRPVDMDQPHAIQCFGCHGY